MYTQQEKDERFEQVCQRIEAGESVRSVLFGDNSPIGSELFYQILDSDDEKSKRYARACAVRADKIFDEVLDIAEHTGEDHTPFTGSNVVQRDKLRIDARKWVLSKLDPKRYGDKIDLEHTGPGGGPIKTQSEHRVIFEDYTKDGNG